MKKEIYREENLSYKKYEELLYDGNVDDETYGEWKNRQLYNVLGYLKRNNDKRYIKIYNGRGYEYYNFIDWFGEE